MLKTIARYRIDKIICYGLLTIGLVFVITTFSSATIINIPDDYQSIQEGIDASVDYDTVLVAPGRYLENVNLRGKDVLLTSHFMFDKNADYIFNTIIDGSNQLHPDTGSTILVINLEGPFTTIQGFTITGGTGTLNEWQAGSIDRTGGGIFVQNSLPVIQYNYIVGNMATDDAGLYSAGGGGIRVIAGNPIIQNNIIAHNQGHYGAGIGLGFCAPIIRNNVIAYNTGGSKYAGSGIQINQGGPVTIENNTIIGNSATLTGAAIRSFSSPVILRNNIIWHNIGPLPHVQDVPNGDYCNLENITISGTGNISVEPHLDMNDWMYPYDDSPDIDGGNPDAAYNDIENPDSPGTAMWPAFGTSRNDIGAYGGPGAFPFHPAKIYSDIYYGEPPFTVSFGGYANQVISSWIWDFDDGDSASTQVTSHLFDTPGEYQVTLAAITAVNDTLVNIQPVYALADTIKTADLEYSPSASTQVEIAINLINNAPAQEIIIPVEYGGDIELEYNSFNTIGCRTSDFNGIEVTVDEINKTLLFSIKSDLENPEYLPSGNGAVLNIIFDVTGSPSGETVIAMNGFGGNLPNITSDGFEYAPEISNGTITLAFICGDANGDGNVNIVDASFVVNYIFFGGTAPNPVAAGDANNDGSTNIVDASYVVNYIFFGGPAPCSQ